MTKNILYLIVVLSQINAFGQNTRQDFSELSIDQQYSANQIWANAVNNDINALANSYTNNPIKVLSDLTVFDSTTEIVGHYQSKKMRVDSIWTIKSVKANSRFNYEIGAFKSRKKVFKHIIITDASNKEKRTLEFIAKSSSSKPYLAELKKRRDKWIELCNLNNAANLITALYHNPSVYYNHRPPILDQASLISEYGYMNNPAYNLKLSPIHIEMVSDDMAFEIGQCEGSYNGKYVLIWKKGKNKEWKILLDSNI